MRQSHRLERGPLEPSYLALDEGVEGLLGDEQGRLVPVGVADGHANVRILGRVERVHLWSKIGVRATKTCFESVCFVEPPRASAHD